MCKEKNFIDEINLSMEESIERYLGIYIEKKDEEIYLSSSDEYEISFDALQKMKKYKDNPDKLKEVRKKYNIPKEIFNEKIKNIMK